jgi:hypothetical protein
VEEGNNDSDENPEMKLLEKEDKEIKRSLSMEEEPEQDENPEAAWDSKAFNLCLQSPFIPLLCYIQYIYYI